MKTFEEIREATKQFSKESPFVEAGYTREEVDELEQKVKKVLKQSYIQTRVHDETPLHVNIWCDVNGKQVTRGNFVCSIYDDYSTRTLKRTDADNVEEAADKMIKELEDDSKEKYSEEFDLMQEDAKHIADAIQFFADAHPQYKTPYTIMDAYAEECGVDKDNEGIRAAHYCAEDNDMAWAMSFNGEKSSGLFGDQKYYHGRSKDPNINTYIAKNLNAVK